MSDMFLLKTRLRVETPVIFTLPQSRAWCIKKLLFHTIGIGDFWVMGLWRHIANVSLGGFDTHRRTY